MHYPPTPQRKACNCSDPCISTDDIYYAGPNLPNSGINTYNVLTSVIEKLDAIYAIPTLQRVTEMGNLTILPIIADSFVKIGGDGTNLLLDDGTVLPIGDLPASVTETSQLINDGEDGINPFITALDIPAFNPSDYDLDEFTNTGIDPFAHVSDIPAPLGYTPVNKAGDTMLGDLILHSDPLIALQAATKQYVDNIASGINFHSPVYTATTINLVANYTNGISGVGAKLTAISNGAISVDGESPGYLERVLVFNQTNQIENGIYDVTVVGDSLTPFELTRSTDADNSPIGELRYGDYTFILSGDTNGGRGFICNTLGIIIIGVTPITFVQFNAAQVVTPGYGLENPSPSVIAIDPLVTQEKITLTTTGSYGPATFITNTLNIPTLLQATTSVNGYLTSTDWNTFNNKENAISSGTSLQYWRGDKTFQTLNTSVVPENTNLYFTNSRAQSALAGMYEVPLTFSTPLIRTVNTISLQQSNTSTDGYLSSTDWNTFNNKQVALVSATNIKTVGGTSILGTGDIPLIYPVIETATNYTLSSTDNGLIIIFTASATLTIPLGLPSGFECTFVTLTGVVLSIPAVVGITLYNSTNPTGSNTMLPQLTFTLKRRIATDSYIATGNI